MITSWLSCWWGWKTLGALMNMIRVWLRTVTLWTWVWAARIPRAMTEIPVLITWPSSADPFVPGLLTRVMKLVWAGARGLLLGLAAGGLLATWGFVVVRGRGWWFYDERVWWLG